MMEIERRNRADRAVGVCKQHCSLEGVVNLVSGEGVSMGTLRVAKAGAPKAGI